MYKFTRFVFIFIGILLVLGCQTPPQPPNIIVQTIEVVETRTPLTAAIIDRLNRPVEDFQLFLFGRISLERNFTVSTGMVDERGSVSFLNEHVRERIIVNDQTPGLSIRSQLRGEELIVQVSFEDDVDSLEFTCRNSNPDGFFELKYEPSDRSLQSGNKKGTLVFKNINYDVNYAGNRTPHLLIRLSQEDRDRLFERTLRGRLKR